MLAGHQGAKYISCTHFWNFYRLRFACVEIFLKLETYHDETALLADVLKWNNTWQIPLNQDPVKTLILPSAKLLTSGHDKLGDLMISSYSYGKVAVEENFGTRSLRFHCPWPGLQMIFTMRKVTKALLPGQNRLKNKKDKERLNKVSYKWSNLLSRRVIVKEKANLDTT